jgi:hypothetical protein
MNKIMLAYVPMLYKLDICSAPTVTKRPGQKPDARAGFALAFAGVNNDNSFLGFIIFKSHSNSCILLSDLLAEPAAQPALLAQMPFSL